MEILPEALDVDWSWGHTIPTKILCWCAVAVPARVAVTSKELISRAETIPWNLSVPLDKSPKIFGGNNRKAVVEIYINDNIYKLQIHQKDIMTVKFHDSTNIYIQKELLLVNQQKQIAEQKLRKK